MSTRDVIVVVQKGDHSLGYYDFGTGEEMARIPVDPYPHEFAVSKDHRVAFLAHFGVALAHQDGLGGNTVSIVDLQARQRLRAIECGEYRRLHDVALDAKGRLYALSEGSSSLLVIRDTHRGKVDAVLPTHGAGSHMVSVTTGGDIAFCSNMDSNTVTALFPTDPERQGVVLSVGKHPEGSVFDEEEQRLFVVNRESAEISIIDVKHLKVTGGFGTPAGPVRICRTPEGLLLVALYYEAGLAIIDPNNPTHQKIVRLPDTAISVGYHPPSKTALLSTHAHYVCLVDIEDGRHIRSVRTRQDPDPVVVLPLVV